MKLNYDARRRKAHSRPTWWLLVLQGLVLVAFFVIVMVVMTLAQWLAPAAFTGPTDITSLILGLTLIAATWRLGNASLDELCERQLNRRDGV